MVIKLIMDYYSLRILPELLVINFEYINSFADLVKLNILLLAKSYLVFQLFISRVETFTRMYQIPTYFAVAKYFNFVMVKN